MIKKRIASIALIGVSVWGVLLGLSTLEGVNAQEPDTNLLVNGNFEAGAEGAWPFQDGIPEVQVAPGWRAFYLDLPPVYAKVPANCKANDPGCYWRRPEFRGMSSGEFSYRVHSGFLAQKYFTFGGQHEAGLLQQVSGIQSATRLRFAVYLHTWSCLPEGDWNRCPTAPQSNQPAPMHTRVGIDPAGGTDPWAASVVWSPEMEAYDVWTLFQVEADAQADRVTVFIYSRADWVDGWFRLNNDVYIDDASLVVVTPPPTATRLPTATAASSPTPLASPTPTLPPPTPTETPTPEPPTPTPAPTETPTATPSPTPTVVPPTPGPEYGSVCALAYADHNGDAFWQADTEALLPDVVLSLHKVSGELVSSYTTDGSKEFYCWMGLPAGPYRLSVQPPAGYMVSGPFAATITVGAAMTPEVGFGLKQSENAAGAAEGTEEAPAATGAVLEEALARSTAMRTLRTVIAVMGGVELVLATAVGLLLVRLWRR